MPFEPPKNLRSIEALVEIMARLRDPNGGCPWDLEQDYETIAPYTIEEAYEVFDAITRKDFPHLKDELGDLLFQAVYHAQMADEDGHFDFGDVVETICEKMIRRHPHVFGDAEERTSEGQVLAWEEIKAEERQARGEKEPGTLDGLPLALPALLRGYKLQRRAARVGFDWPDIEGARAKVEEEMEELEREVEAGDQGKIEAEFGDLLFAMVNVGRFLGVDPEKALRQTNEKFVSRFEYMEEALAAKGQVPQDVGLETLDRLWNEAKKRQ